LPRGETKQQLLRKFQSFGEVVVQFDVMRATKSAVSAAAFALALAGGPFIQVTYAQAAGAQQPAQGGQQKNWKDRAEYDLYNSIAHEQDPQKRLDLLDQWTQKYPSTDFEDLRTQTYLGTYGPLSQKDPAVRPKAVAYFKQALQKDPKNTTALYFLALNAPQMGGSSPSPDQIADKLPVRGSSKLKSRLTHRMPTGRKPRLTSMRWRTPH
jgi:hypothetical protein